MSKPRVFVIAHPTRYDSFSKRYVPAFDLSPAREYGDLFYVLPPDSSRGDPQAYLPMLQEKFAAFTKDDFLLPIGNPILIAWGSALAAKAAGGALQILEWPRLHDPRAGRYYLISEKLY